ncbi:MAG: divalent metal cation transporter [Patescibacteria group bacterium]
MSKKENFAKKIWRKIGPGFITGASDDDPSGIVIYSITGAKSWYNFLWTPIITLPLMIGIQELCGKIALTTRKGLAGIIKTIVHPYIAYSVAFLMFFANTFNVAADLRAIADSLNLITNIPPEFWQIITALFVIIIITFLSYSKFANIMKIFTFSLFAYIASALMVKTNWVDVLHFTFLPKISFTKETFLMLAAILGTTISPYLFFWQGNEEIEEIENRPELKPKKVRREIKKMRADTIWGMFFSNLVMFFIILASANVLYSGSGVFTKNGLDTLSIKEIAGALRPIAGDLSYFLFALAIIGTGLLAIPVLSGGAAYILSEVFGFSACLNKKVKDAKLFYLAISSSVFLGLILSFMPIRTIDLLFYTGVMFTILSPFLIFLILMISNNKKIMGDYKNNFWENSIGIITLIIMAVVSVLSFW